MEILTIRVTPNGIEVIDGKEPRAKLKYVADNLEIYLVGAVKIGRRPAVNHMAMECALARHIPLISLKSYGWV